MAGCINPPYVPAAGDSACFLTVACAVLSFVDPILGQPKPRVSASRSSAYPKKRRKARSKGQSRVTAIDSSQLALDLAPSVRPGTPVWVPGTQSWRGSSQRSPERASPRTYRAASRKDVVAALDAGTQSHPEGSGEKNENNVAVLAGSALSMRLNELELQSQEQQRRLQAVASAGNSDAASDAGTDFDPSDWDLSDPKLLAAALRIQAVFRGHDVRRPPGLPDTSDEEDAGHDAGPKDRTSQQLAHGGNLALLGFLGGGGGAAPVQANGAPAAEEEGEGTDDGEEEDDDGSEEEEGSYEESSEEEESSEDEDEEEQREHDDHLAAMQASLELMRAAK